MIKLKTFCIVIFIGYFSLVIGNCVFAETKTYDGVWFLGFNEKSAVFGDENGRLVRQAVTIAIDREKIAKKIIGDETVPIGIIPPSMEGYDAELQAYPHDYGQAKRMMRSAGYTLSDKRIKTIRLLHTDGEKTIEIVNEIKRDLINLGFDITTIPMKFSDNDKWQAALRLSKYDMFVMGYKSGTLGQIYIADKATDLFHTFTCENNPTIEADIAYFNTYEEAAKSGFKPDSVCNPQPEKEPKTLALIQPILYNEGDANFTSYKNKRVDMLLEDLSTLDESLKVSRQEKFEEIGHIVWEDCPIVPLFYITRL